MAETNELTASGYREVMQGEIKRLNGLCSDWQSKADGDGQVRCAIGKASILISGKIRQFSGLIDDCEAGGKAQRTRLGDLQGFWEMIGLQIDNVDAMFRALSQPQNQEDGQDENVPLKSKKKVTKRPVSNISVKRPPSSDIKAHILAKRREMSLSKKPAPSAVTSQAVALKAVDERVDKIFDGGFFKVKSPLGPSPSQRLHHQQGGSAALSPMGYNARKGTSSTNTAAAHDQSASTTPLAIMAATKALRKSLSPSVRRSYLDFNI